MQQLLSAHDDVVHHHHDGPSPAGRGGGTSITRSRWSAAAGAAGLLIGAFRDTAIPRRRRRVRIPAGTATAHRSGSSPAVVVDRGVDVPVADPSPGELLVKGVVGAGCRRGPRSKVVRRAAGRESTDAFMADKQACSRAPDGHRPLQPRYGLAQVDRSASSSVRRCSAVREICTASRAASSWSTLLPPSMGRMP